MKRRVINLITILILMGMVSSCASSTGIFDLRNESSEPIRSVSISICGQTFVFKQVGVSRSLTQSYRITTDGNFDIGVEFESGRKITRSAGYVTNGIDARHEIVITGTDIDVKIVSVGNKR
jgi:hypothetical protein